ncbi:alpha/beta fold hydrolase [Prolixibacteraceae bacterium Z1-6]|uniref:Alpha/beta fold hydrolase n=1 Tax=Draconibacterium aestuarii TaxID=2998507 RepID=A0A9X3J599_9BACT|nr:alpha/beta fold hydrolase [Prolixibacteraceae bacterium Z1-6]
MQKPYQLLFPLFFLILSFMNTVAQQPAVQGSWSGKIEIPNAQLEVVFNITEDNEKNPGATMDVPQQGASNLPVGKVTVSNDSLILNIPVILGTFKGKFVTTDSIAGIWQQNGQEFVLNLSKTGEVKEIKRPQTPVPPFNYVSENVEYINPKSGYKLAGTLTLPKNAKNCRAVVLISGSGAQDRNETIYGHKPFWVIAHYLTNHGIAVLRIDDRGVGDSEGDIRIATSEDFADDVLCGVDFLKKRNEIDPTQIGLIGHSEGGIIAPMVANSSKDMAFIILMAGPGIPGDSILIEQTVLAAKASGIQEQAINAKLFMTRGIINIVKTTPDAEERTLSLQKAFSGGMYNRMDDDRKKLIDQQISTFNNNWFSFFINYDPYPALTRVTCPVLALIGEKDVQVPPKSNLPAIKKALTEGGNTNFKTMELPHLNHLFQNCETGAPMEYAKIEETISPEVLVIMKDWISEIKNKK